MNGQTVIIARKDGGASAVSAIVSGVWALHDCTVTHVPTGTRVCFGAQTGRVNAEALWRDLSATWPDYGAGAVFGEQDASRVDARWDEFRRWHADAAKRHGVCP